MIRDWEFQVLLLNLNIFKKICLVSATVLTKCNKIDLADSPFW